MYMKLEHNPLLRRGRIERLRLMCCDDGERWRHNATTWISRVWKWNEHLPHHSQDQYEAGQERRRETFIPRYKDNSISNGTSRVNSIAFHYAGLAIAIKYNPFYPARTTPSPNTIPSHFRTEPIFKEPDDSGRMAKVSQRFPFIIKQFKFNTFPGRETTKCSFQSSKGCLCVTPKASPSPFPW